MVSLTTGIIIGIVVIVFVFFLVYVFWYRRRNSSTPLLFSKHNSSARFSEISHEGDFYLNFRADNTKKGCSIVHQYKLNNIETAKAMLGTCKDMESIALKNGGIVHIDTNISDSPIHK